MASEQINIVLKAFDKTKQAFNSTQRGLDKVKRSVMSLKGALVSLGATAAVSKMSKDIDSLGKTSAKLGIAVQELQGLRYAASTAGIETNTLDMAMQRFTRRLAEARKGTGEAKGALEEMGIALKDSNGNAYTQVQVLDQVANAFSRMTDPADKVRLAFKLFDAEGVSMVNMLENGAAGVKGLREEFDALGADLTENQVAAVELANDKFTAMTTVFGKLGEQISVFVIPALAKLAEFIIKTLALAFAGLVMAIEAAINALKEAYNFAADLTGAFDEVAMTDFSELTNDIFAMIKAIENVGKASTKSGQQLGENLAGVVVGKESPVGSPTKANIETIEKAQNALEDYSKAVGYAKVNLQSMALQGVQRLEDSLVGLIDGTKSVKDSFKDMARSIVSDLIRMQIQQSITGPLSGMLSGFSLFGGSTGGATSYAAPPVPQFRALGGSVSAGQAYTVGEHGRETFIPSSNGTIVPNGGETVVRVELGPDLEAKIISQANNNAVKIVDQKTPTIVKRSVSAVGEINRETSNYLGRSV